MFQILGFTIPVYLLIGVGYAAVRAGMFNAADMRVLGRFVIGFCLPGLLFNALAQRNLSEILHARYLAAYALGSLLPLLVGLWVMWRLRGKTMDLAALQGMGMAQSNSGFFGFAIAAPLLGEPASIALALTMIIENMVTMPIGLVLMDAGAGGLGNTRSYAPAFKVAMQGLLRSPMIIAIFSGFVFAMLGLRLPEPLARTVQMVATASSPVALFVIGGTLAGFGLKGYWNDISLVAVGKLLVHPLLVGLSLWLFGVTDLPLMAAAVIYAAAPMMSIYPVIAQKHGHEGLAAATLMVTTLASFLSVNAVLWIMRHGLGWLP